jgi:large repetitive protein
MVDSVALIDVVAPYAFGGAAIGEPLHTLISALFVQQLETCCDDSGVVISGVARFSADLTANPPRFTPPASISFDGTVDVNHSTARHEGAFWDFPDIAIQFRLSAPRASSPAADAVTGGPSGTPAPKTKNTAAASVLAGMGQGIPSIGQPAQDAPSTVFHLDLLVDAATLHLPFLTPAMLGADGMLAIDAAKKDVKVTLPKIKLSFEQTAGTANTDPQLTIALDSWAAEDIDDPAGTAYAELLRMDPPYALIGPETVLGFGFQSLILDLSSTETPPELLAKFGVGDDFRGLYLPDVRVFVRPPGLDGLGIDVSARELLIGIGPEGGVSGVFGLDVVKPDAPQDIVVSIYDQFGGFLSRLEFDTTTNTHDPVDVPPATQWVIDVHGGQPPYNIDVDGQVQTTDPIDVSFPAGQQEKTVTIAVADVHVGGQSRTITVPLRIHAPSLTAGTLGQGGAQPAQPTVTIDAGPGYSITFEDSPSTESVTLVFTPANVTAATVGGQAITVNGGRATQPLAHGAQLDITASWHVDATPANTPLTLSAYFPYAQPAATSSQVPTENDSVWAQYASGAGNLQTAASRDESDANAGWTPEAAPLVTSSSLQAFKAAAQAAPGQMLTVVGMASKEHAPNIAYNVGLSQRRVWALEAFLKANGITNLITGSAVGEQPPPAGTGYLQPGRGAYRRADCTVLTGGSAASDKNAALHLSRPPRPPVPAPVKPAVIQRQPVGDDDYRFKELHLRVEIDNNRLIAVEFQLKIDVTTVLEKKLAEVNNAHPGQGQPGGQASLPVGKKADPNDGVLDIRVQVTLDDTVNRWQVLASLFEQDTDGFLQSPAPSAANGGPDAEQWWRGFVGLLIALAPLTDALAASGSVAGEAVALAVQVGVPFAAMKLDIAAVPRITIYGGELTVTHDDAGTRVVLLLDVEVALVISLDIGGTTIIDTDPKNPITVRYKAVGYATSSTPHLRDLLPVFDSSKGYTIKIPSTGGIKVPAPLGDILQVAGTRIARSNPVNLELDLELKADLGVVSIDKTTIRIPLEGGQAPTISALGVHINVPDAIDGHGFLAIYPDGFAGQLDISLPSVGIRVAGGLAVRHAIDPTDPQRTATAVLVTLEVDFPVPIALGASGLGIYGFGGLFAMHYERDEDPTDPVPALAWLHKVNGNPMDITGWKPEIDHWAIGLGVVLGTMDGGYILNVKGMLIVELPGPRILIVTKAKLLQPKPDRQGDVDATILAVIDLDLARARITVGLIFDYDVKPLLKLHVPVRAIFPFNDLEHFALDAGTYYAPATVEFFKLFTARGYFMIRGKGIPDTDYDAGQAASYPLPNPLGGFSIMTGVSVSFVWGNRASGLYLSVGASIDVGLGFAPLMFDGHLKLWGELHLWVVGIEASAQLAVTAGVKNGNDVVKIDGEVHGKVDLFFFSIEGSVHVTLGDDPDAPPTPPDLVTGVSLQSRAAALLSGVSSDRPIDGKLFDAHAEGPAPAAEAVPIDAIVVVHLDCSASLTANAGFTTTDTAGPVTTVLPIPAGPAQPAVRRGKDFYTYRITGITLDHGVTHGELPVVWWPTEPQPTADSKRELALLSRVPSAHPSAVERSKRLDDLLNQTWASICDQIAPATAVLWTFHDSPLGDAPNGWVLQGTAWPDPPGSTRSTAPALRLDIAETWRTHDPVVDIGIDIAPARVVGGPTRCDERCAPRVPAGRLPAVPGRELLTLAAPRGVAANAALARFAVLSCWVHLLEAPFRRYPDAALLAAHPLGDILSYLADQSAAQRADPLDDVIAFKTGTIVELRVLLGVPELLLDAHSLFVRLFDETGNVLDEFPIENGPRSRVNVHPADLPPRWTDPTGPWFCRVNEVVEYLPALGPLPPAAAPPTTLPVLLDTAVPDGTAYVHIGVRNTADLLGKGFNRPNFLVGVIETIAAAEVAREQHDTLVKDSTLTVIDGALADPADPPALLLPGTDYTVAVSWEWATCDDNGVVAAGATWTPATQPFQFRTDTAPLAPRSVQVGDAPAQTMPVRLDPWVLLTDPADGDHFVFYGDPINVVFTVDYLLTMYATYNTAIQAHVRASSFKNTAPTDPNYAKTVAALDVGIVKPLPGANVFTPWEDTVRKVLDGKPCISASGQVSRHQIATLDLLLEPRTDYIFDIEETNAPPVPPGTAARPLFRRAFTTSRYRDFTEMAADVAAATLVESPVAAADVAGLEALTGPNPVSATDLDAALRRAGLHPVGDVPNPVVELLWVPSGAALQPRVLVIRTPEPLCRDRKQPDSYQPPGVPRLQRSVITLVDKPFLDVVPTAGVAGAPNLHIVTQAAMNTVVVVIDDGRGRPIDLSLRRYPNPFLGEADGPPTDTALFAVTLDAATWEVI